jgi:hypothetical protein
MEGAPTRSRRVLMVSTGARVCIMLGLLLVVVAAYLFWSPLEKPTKEGIPFGCSSAANSPSDPFQRKVCGKLNERRQMQAGGFLLAAVIVGVGGVLTFGSSRTVEHARPTEDAT